MKRASTSSYGVGKTYGPQLIAEIGDVSRFTHREALTAFAGVDPGVDESGQHKSKSNRASKVGSARLRKTLFQIMRTMLQNAPEDDPVYRFLDKKRSQGKPYYVYMTAGANKFLRIYYGKVKECLRNLEQDVRSGSIILVHYRKPHHDSKPIYFCGDHRVFALSK